MPSLAMAVMPYPPTVVTSPSGNRTAQLSLGLRAVSVSLPEGETLLFTDEQLPSRMPFDLGFWRFGTTKDWHRQAICLFDRSERFLAIRLASGRCMVLDLQERTWWPGLPPEIAREVLGGMRARVTALLASDEAWERETGAIHAGSLRMEEAIPRLQELLRDEVTISQRSYTSGRPTSSKTQMVYFVRVAAKDALLAMMVDPGEVVTEFEPEQVQRYDRATGQLIWVPNVEEPFPAPAATPANDKQP
jgi:hypothetical protein